MPVELLLYFQFAVILTGLYLSYFFLFSNARNNYWLGALALSLSLHFSNLFLKSQLSLPHLGLVFGLVYGPLIYSYVRSHFVSASRNKPLHFIPALLLLFWILFVDRTRGITPESEILITSIFVFIHLFVYIKLSHDQYQKFRVVLKQSRSKTDDNRLKIVRRIIIGIAILYSFSIMHTLSGLLSNYDIETVVSLLISVTLVFGMFNIIYQAMNNTFVFTPFSNEEEQLAKKENQYISSALTHEDATRYKAILIKHLETSKCYADSELSINTLASQTKIPVRFLSQLINQSLKQNFFDLINSYRIKDAQAQLENPGKRISEIMYDVGFNSRSSFNSAFKKYTGKTPSQFRKEFQ